MKRLFWIGSSRESLKEFPDEVQVKWGMDYIWLKWAIGIVMQKRLVD